MAFKLHSYFRDNEPEQWEAVGFHRCWIDQNDEKPEVLQYSKAAEQFTLNLQNIISTSTNADTVRKAQKLIVESKASIHNSLRFAATR